MNKPATAPQENRMDLLLWRHAEAEDGYPDLTRRLTRHGEKQAQKVAAWLRQHAPADLHIVVSPATRCQQTAAALGLPFFTEPRLSTDYDAAALLSVVGELHRRVRTILVVGHQPTLGEVAALQLTGAPIAWQVKKGALWWLSTRAEPTKRTQLRAVIDPELA